MTKRRSRTGAQPRHDTHGEAAVASHRNGSSRNGPAISIVNNGAGAFRHPVFFNSPFFRSDKTPFELTMDFPWKFLKNFKKIGFDLRFFA